MRPLSPRTAHLPPLPPSVDLVVVGAGIVGLAHAVEAHARGYSVLVVERDPHSGGAAARRSGHVAVTTQDAATLSCALATRERWLKLGREAGFWVKDAGAVVVAHSAAELAVLDDLVAARDGDAQLLGAAAARERAGVQGDDVVGGAFLPLDLRVETREALSAIAAWLDAQPRADVAWSTTAWAFEAGSGRTLVRTSRGEVVARRVVVAVGADLDRFYPGEAARAGLRHDLRQVLRVTAPGGAAPDDGSAAPVVLDGTTLLRDAAYAHSPSRADVRARLHDHAPGLLDADVHLSFTRHHGPDGATLVVGDARDPGPGTDGSGLERSPARSEAADELLLRAAGHLLGMPPEAPLRVLRRWTVPDVVLPRSRRGPFAGTLFLVADPVPGVTTVTVAGGLGTTTALGLATKVVDGLF